MTEYYIENNTDAEFGIVDGSSISCDKLGTNCGKSISQYIQSEEEKRMKIKFRYQNGSEYVAKDVVAYKLEDDTIYFGKDFSNNDVYAGGWETITYTQQPDKYTTISKTIPADDLVGFIVKENNKTTIYDNPKYKTAVDAGIETMRQRIRRHNRKKPVQSVTQDWRDVKSFIE